MGEAISKRHTNAHQVQNSTLRLTQGTQFFLHQVLLIFLSCASLKWGAPRHSGIPYCLNAPWAFLYIAQNGFIISHAWKGWRRLDDKAKKTICILNFRFSIHCNVTEWKSGTKMILPPFSFSLHIHILHIYHHLCFICKEKHNCVSKWSIVWYISTLF